MPVSEPVSGVPTGRYSRPHTEQCLVYRYAEALIGVDRRGLCDCEAEILEAAHVAQAP
jgi:hypothetical protein